MVKRIGGNKRRTRSKYTRPVSQKGKISLRKYFAEFTPGDKVILKVDSIVTEGVFHPRYTGKIGLVKKKRGNSYEVNIDDRGVKKMLIVHPMHMKKC